MAEDDREIYAGRILTLRLRHLRQPDGSVHVREIVEHADGAAIVALDAEDHVLLVRQYRPAVDAHLLELPAGLVDPGETPLECARRELTEETGFIADSVAPLINFYSSPGFSTEMLHLFAATSLRPSPTPYHDPEEDLELVRLPLAVAVERVMRGEISDAKTVSGLLAFWQTRR